jgi:hypothetical protein
MRSYLKRFRLIKLALGEDAKLESFGVVLSLSGAQPQKVHRDAPILFGNGIGTILPVHALTVVLPLVWHSRTQQCNSQLVHQD